MAQLAQQRDMYKTLSGAAPVFAVSSGDAAAFGRELARASGGDAAEADHFARLRHCYSIPKDALASKDEWDFARLKAGGGK